MALKKRNARKSRVMPEQARRNLELLFQNNFQMAMIFVNIGFMAIVVGAIAFYQVGGGIAGSFIILTSSLILSIMIILMAYFLTKAGRIAKILGVKETAKKYGLQRARN